MVGDFIICLPAFFNIYIFIYSFFIFKKRGVQKGVQKGIQKGVQKGGPEGRVHVLSTVLGRNVHLFIHLFVFYPFLHYEFLKCIPWQLLGWNWWKMTLAWTTVSFQTSGWIEGSMDVKSWNFLICIFFQLSCCKKLTNNDGYILTVLSKATTEFWKTNLVGFTLYQKQFWWEVISLMYRKGHQRFYCNCFQCLP